MAIIKVTNNADNGNGSLREAIAIAKSGDTIEFASGLSDRTITLNKPIAIRKSLNIDGSDASGLTISGGEQTNLFRLSQENQNLAIRNLTLADSYHETEVGSAIWATDNSTVEIDNVDFIDHVSQGAALHGQEGSVFTVVDSTFDNNDGTVNSTKRYSAGAISMFGYGSLSIDNSVFTNNKGDSGGAIHIALSELTIEDSTFVGNDSTSGANKGYLEVPGGGGAVYIDGASVPQDPRFVDPNFTERLELAQTENGTFKVSNSYFEDNIAAGEGGAILAYGYNQDTIIIEDSEIINNEVIENLNGSAKGGGLRLSGFVEIDNTIIDNNQSADKGGGIYLRGEVPTKISNSSFSGNEAVNGGAIYDALWSSSTQINNTNFESNSATNQAGVFFSQNNRPISFQNSQFIDNTPNELNDVSFSGNIPDIVYGTNSHNTIIGKDQNSHLVGLKGNDTIRGKKGNDYLNGDRGSDNLFGGLGNDTLIGGNGINNIVGGDGNDIFIGGNGRDIIEGGKGQDKYIIGDSDRMFYTNKKWYDHAVITDFQLEQDTIQLQGKANDYTIKSATNEGVSGTGIFHNNGMVALVGDISPSNFSLNADYISYSNSANG